MLPCYSYDLHIIGNDKRIAFNELANKDFPE